MSDKLFTAKDFYAFLGEHKLMGSRCKACGAVYAPPRPTCPACLDDGAGTAEAGAALEWIELSGKGELAAYTVIHIAPTAMLEAGYDRKHPYCSGVVALAEGPRVSAQILGVDVSAPETIEIGMPLKVAFIERGEGEVRKTYLAFEGAGSK